MPQAKKCEHKLAGKNRVCKLKVVSGTKFCWQHQPDKLPAKISAQMESQLRQYINILESEKRRKRRKNPVRRKKAKKKTRRHNKRRKNKRRR